MPAPQFIEGQPIIKYDEVQLQSATITHGTNNTKICGLTTQRGMRAFVIRLSQAWDAGLDPNVTWYLRVNQVNRYPFEGSTVQISAPESDAYIVPLEVPEATDIEIYADLAGTVDGKVTGRLGVAYIDK